MKTNSSRQSNVCPLCQASILHFETDKFCVSCDWNTMFADVQSGRFEQRLGLKKPAKSQPQPTAAVARDGAEIERRATAAFAPQIGEPNRPNLTNQF